MFDWFKIKWSHTTYCTGDFSIPGVSVSGKPADISRFVQGRLQRLPQGSPALSELLLDQMRTAALLPVVIGQAEVQQEFTVKSVRWNSDSED